MNLRTHAILAVLTAFALAAAPATRPSSSDAVKPQPAGPQKVVHRVTGLFSPEREADLRVALEQVPGVELVSIDLDRGVATFSYDPAVAFKGTKPDKLAERFDNLLKAASNSSFGVKPLSITPREKLARVELGIGLLDCKACCLAVYEILTKVDGVEQAIVTARDGRVIVSIDPAKTDRDKLAAALNAREVTVK